MNKPFLGHKTYEELKELIGPVATVSLAKHYVDRLFIFPNLTQ